jgi:hypothetical protein
MESPGFELRRWYWFATAAFLALGVLGRPAGTAAAIGLTGVQLAHFAWTERRLASLAMQVRWLFLAVLLLGLWHQLAALHVLAVAGASVNVSFGYCLAARMLSLMPWNRRVPLSAGLIAWTFLEPPATTSILDRGPQPPTSQQFGAGAPAGAYPASRATPPTSPYRSPRTRG